MRIPTSVIVMSVVTAVPFGLAIRDTLKHEGQGLEGQAYAGSVGTSRQESLDRARKEELLREMEREEVARAEHREQQLAKLDDIYGTRAASFGTLFEGVVLGGDAASFEPEAARERIEKVRRDGLLSVEFDVGTTLRAVTVAVHGNDYNSSTNEVIAFCATLRERLVATWGQSTGGVWTDAATHNRARLENNNCNLTFERYLEPRDWLAAVSPDLLGTKAQPVLAANGATVDDDGAGASWHVPGVGAGRTETAIGVTIAHGKLAEIEAHTTTDFDTYVLLRDQLTELLKVEPTEDRETGVWTWKRRGKLPVQMFYGSSGSLALYSIKQ